LYFNKSIQVPLSNRLWRYPVISDHLESHTSGCRELDRWGRSTRVDCGQRWPLTWGIQNLKETGSDRQTDRQTLRESHFWSHYAFALTHLDPLTRTDRVALKW